VLEFGTDRLGDRRRQVVAEGADDLVGWVVDMEIDGDERPQRGDEQPEREHGEQEPVGDLGGQTRHIVFLHALEEAIAQASPKVRLGRIKVRLGRIKVRLGCIGHPARLARTSERRRRATCVDGLAAASRPP
jgi:hypothetical protein